jgi:hypothetical protein
VNVRWWLVLVAISLAACGAPTALPAPNTIEPLRVLYPPALGWMQSSMAQCANAQPGLGVYRYEATNLPSLAENDVLLWWGTPPQSGRSFSIGDDQLSVIVHPNRKSATFSEDDLRNLFSGQKKTWADGSPLQVWVYAPDDPLWKHFADVLALTVPPPDALIAPNPVAMRASIAEDPSAIGFLPGGALDSSVQAASLNENLAEKFRQTITATVLNEPAGLTGAWLQCLQSSWQP